MSLTEIINEIVKLTPSEKDEVRAALDFEIDGLSEASRQHLLLERLQRKGIIRSLPTGKRVIRKSRPISIEGKPLSETIIEERR